MGAWIETEEELAEAGIYTRSHPVWVRGLKPLAIHYAPANLESHPVWVRGLKQRYAFINQQ